MLNYLLIKYANYITKYPTLTLSWMSWNKLEKTDFIKKISEIKLLRKEKHLKRQSNGLIRFSV